MSHTLRRRKVIFPGRQVVANNLVKHQEMFSSNLPPWLEQDEPTIEEELETESSALQLETAEECVPLLKRTFPPSLKRADHTRFLMQALGRLPAGFAALDASRPWMLYWSLSAFAALGVDLSNYRERCVLRPWKKSCSGPA